MSKRFQPMKEFGRSMKKPKLDISINNRNTSNAVRKIIESKQSSTGRNVSPVKSSPNNFWDDDDDDVILLATQKAEAAVAAKLHCDGIYNITESEITFSEFANAATTSTQQSVSCEIPGPDILSQMFNDDDEDFELLAAVEKTDPGIFKKPTIPPPSAQSNAMQIQKNQNTQVVPQSNNTARIESSEPVEFVLSQNTGPESTLPPTQSAARRQLASERQIKFLMEKVDALKKENSKLSKDLTDTKTKVASKEGEASLLRDELRHLKQQAQTLRVENILNAKNVQNECRSKINEMTKVVEGKDAQVKLKAIECSLVKMRFDTTQRLQQSIGGDVSIQKFQTKQKTTRKPTEIIQCRTAKSILKMPSFNVCSLPISKIEEYSQIHPLIYEHSSDKGSSKKQRTLFQLELDNILTKLAQLQLLGPEKLPEDFKKLCIDSVCKVLPEFWTYTHSLEFPKNRRIHPYHDYSLSNTKYSLRKSYDSTYYLQGPTELYDDERCLCLRRYITALAIICQQVPDLSNAIVEYKHSNYYLLQIATDSIIKLSFSREICEHFGVLEAFAFWLNSLLVHVSSAKSNNSVEMLLDLMKSLVFARPNAWIFREISIVLRRCCRLPNALENLCVNSPESSFVSDRVRSTYRYTNESCFLQVYCGLLEIAFPLNTRLHLEHLKLLAVICLNHVHFVYHCFQRPPTFIQKLLPLYDDDDGEVDDIDNIPNSDKVIQNSSNKIEQNLTTKFSTLNSNSTTPLQNKIDNNVKICNQNCECYVKLCLSAVTLVFQLLRQWLLHKKEHCTQQITEISRLAVQLLHTIFCENYLTSLFRESEETTKLYLSLIVKCWSDNTKQLQFNEINLKFLNKLQNSHVLPRNITTETNYQNIMADLTEWQKCTKDKVSHLKPPTNIQEAENCVSKLNLLEAASNQNTFFESLKGFAFNFQ